MRLRAAMRGRRGRGRWGRRRRRGNDVAAALDEESGVESTHQARAHQEHGHVWSQHVVRARRFQHHLHVIVDKAAEGARHSQARVSLPKRDGRGATSRQDDEKMMRLQRESHKQFRSGCKNELTVRKNARMAHKRTSTEQQKKQSAGKLEKSKLEEVRFAPAYFGVICSFLLMFVQLY